MSSFRSDYNALKLRFGRFTKTWYILRYGTPNGMEERSLSLPYMTAGPNPQIIRVLRCPMHTAHYDITPSLIQLQRGVRAYLNRAK